MKVVIYPQLKEKGAWYRKRRVTCTRICLPLLVSLMLLVSLLFPARELHARYLEFIDRSRLPAELVPSFDSLTNLEPYVEQFRTDWPFQVPKSEATRQIREIYDKASALSREHPTEELHLFLGLVCHFGHNLDITGYEQKAEEHLNRAMTLARDDFRPLWFLGMHYAKAGQGVKGMEQLLKAEERFHPSNVPFWEDYAFAAYITAMPKHSLFALSKIKDLTGGVNKLDEVVGVKLRTVLRTPDRADHLDPQKLWDSTARGEIATVASYPFGYKITLPAGFTQNVGFRPYDGKVASLKIRLTAREGATGQKFIPNMFIHTFVVDDDERLVPFMQRFMKSIETWEGADFNLNLREVSYIGRSDKAEVYRSEGGGRVVLIAFGRTAPVVSGFLLEEPYDFPKESQTKEGPTWYRYEGRTERFREKIFYQIWLEAPDSVFGKTLEEFKGILRTLVVE